MNKNTLLFQSARFPSNGLWQINRKTTLRLFRPLWPWRRLCFDMKYCFYTFLFIIIPSIPLQAQHHDNHWLLGYASGPGPGDEFGISQLSFDSGSVTVKENFEIYAGFSDNDVVFSDKEGRYRCAFNGVRIFDQSFKIMKNGDSIFYETEPNLIAYSAGNISQGGLALPWPNHPDSLLLFYTSKGIVGTDLANLHLQYALIRLSGNNGLGVVEQRRVVVLQDTIQYGRLMSVRHANGRDWWLPITEKNTNRYYFFLISPQGVHLSHQQAIGLPITDGVGQAVFSPDGTHMAVVNSVSSWQGAYLDVYDFDRCTGRLSNHRQLRHPSNSAAGCAFSRNSRYLYVNYRLVMYQYDLLAPDLAASQQTIAEYVPPPPGEFPATFYLMQLAPDNKIYICATNSLRALSVIHRPDERGEACQFERGGLRLPVYNGFSITHNPFYRLGPLDGSPCDTLGLDNVPVAWYRYEQDTLDPLAVAFTDLSYYEPAEWSWDFGDGSLLSGDTSPVHIFPEKKSYKVCLTVRNQYGTHTHCKTLYLGVSAQDNPVLQAQIQVSPNPFSERLAVALSAPEMRGAAFRLFDATGRLVREVGMEYGINEVDASDLGKGLYFWVVEKKGERVKNGKIVKM